MWGWKKTASSEQPQAEPAGPPTEEPQRQRLDTQQESALDTVGALLRVLGKYAFDVDGLDASTLEQECEAWARHVLLGAPKPGLEKSEVEPGGRRDWPGVRRFYQDQRMREQQYVHSSQGDFRQVTWAFLETLRSALLQDQENDERVKLQLSVLTEVVDSGSIELIRSEVLTAVTHLKLIAEERNRSQRERLAELGSRVAELGVQLKQAREEGTLDGLTRLFNRKAFDEQITRLVYLNDVFGQPASLLLIDVDHFKWVNDRFGHPTGDQVLKVVSDCLALSFPRKADFVARYGGEEFAILLSDTPLADAHRLGERLLQAIRDLEIDCNGEVLRISTSAGIAQVQAGEGAEAWIARADAALYRAKEAGRDRLLEAEAA